MKIMESRRGFIASLAASAGAAAFAGKTPSGPNLKVGILSDIHLSQPEKHQSQGAIDTFKRVLEFYKKERVDAVLIAGDLTNGGTMTEMRVVVAAWNEVFGKDANAPEKVFVTGNHEKVYFEQAKKNGELDSPAYADGLYLDVKKNWKELFGEEWSPFFIKTVKGYSFVGAHWAEWFKEKDLRAFLAANRAKLENGRPFFYTQHAHPQNTCYGTWTWHQWDGGPTDKVLSEYPNAVAFSGHTHYTLTDQRSVWQGSFTSIGTAALRWLSMPSGRENYGIELGLGRRMPNVFWGSQGMVMSVWGDRMVFERYDFVNNEKLGDDWVVPVLRSKEGAREYSFQSRMAKTAAPEFPEGAKITLEERDGMSPKTKTKQPEKERQLVVKFPAAVGSDDLSRVFEYEVAVDCVESDVALRMSTKRVYQPGAHMNIKRAGETPSCVFGVCELPEVTFRLSVTPMNSFGMRGKPLVLKHKLKA